VTGDEKWIYLDNPKRRKLGVNSSQLQCQRRIFAGLRTALHLMGSGGCAVL